ncbi:MAG TPA: LD-carboxypeptidase [Ignavibacteriaceae bacterium]|nr:LD-carboxypeptidase [Ignavibacteriaceae bacterium]
MISPPYLKQGDTIAIIATARKVSNEEMRPAIKILTEWGLKVVEGKNLYKQQNQFAGSDSERLEDFQNALDDSTINAILFARGGYGTVRIIDKVDFSKFKKNPKWIIGYSDATVIHSHVHTHFGIETIHGPMAFNFPKSPDYILDSLKQILFGNSFKCQTSNFKLDRKGTAKGILTGGNLSLLYALNNSPSDIDTKNKILYIEDLDEYLYHIDRMMMSLKRSGKLKGLAGLIVGGMTEMKDNTIPFGKTAEEIIAEHVAEYDYPVCFNFPAGHIPNNHPLIFGREVELIVQEKVSLNFLNNSILQ